MRTFANIWRIAPAILALCALPTLAAAQIAGEANPKYAGTIMIDGTGSGRGPLVGSPTIVYDNTTSPALFGFSSTDLTSVMGDEVLTTGLGTLSEMQWSIYNSSSSLGSLLTATCLLSFYDATTGNPFGSASFNVNFGTGLAKGFYTIIDAPNLDALGISITTQDVLVTQKVTAKTGTANRLGIVSFDPPSVGSSPAYFYLFNAANAAGYYNVASGNANPGYQISLNDLPTATRATTWGHVKKLFH